MTAKTIKPISYGQIKLIHVLLDEHGIMDKKREIICSASNGRTTSSKELTSVEARLLINRLKGSDNETEKRQKIYNAIYAVAFEMDIIYGSSEDDIRMNMAKLDVFCRERGTVKKNLSIQSYGEMKLTLRQFKAIYNKHKNNKLSNERISYKRRECEQP